MNLIRSFSQWNEKRNQRIYADMKALGKCPDCTGKGFIMTLTSIHTPTYDSIFDCPGCNGTGQFSDWNSSEEQLH
ncbi:methionine aminopeptidase [uncultured Metabacillus sp.]|uniref:methionine aminopeptidase n=1 Tax=uncultured Metabacillus sp. TaxID=2860135 RepID=UPI002630B530|nr:methionine aminopeptidase [uncultured Metabacillus sp.]